MKKIFLLLFFLYLFSCGVIWYSPSYYKNYGKIDLPVPIMTHEEYLAVINTHPRPCIVQYETSEGGGVLIFGATHTQNPDDPQIESIKRYWNNFRPTVALCEGRLGFLISWFSDPVKNYGESGLVYHLAKKNDVEVYTWEPPRELEISAMLEEFPKEHVALFYVLRPYFSNLRFGKPDNPDKFVEEFRKKRTRYKGLENTLKSIATIDSIWQVDFKGLKDWRDTSDEYGLPGYLKDISAKSNLFRDEHFIRTIIDLVKKGERVFAVSGSSHAVKLDPALKEVFKQIP
jgi:hypothetical protein